MRVALAVACLFVIVAAAWRLSAAPDPHLPLPRSLLPPEPEPRLACELVNSTSEPLAITMRLTNKSTIPLRVGKRGTPLAHRTWKPLRIFQDGRELPSAWDNLRGMPRPFSASDYVAIAPGETVEGTFDPRPHYTLPSSGTIDVQGPGELTDVDEGAEFDPSRQDNGQLHRKLLDCGRLTLTVP